MRLQDPEYSGDAPTAYQRVMESAFMSSADENSTASYSYAYDSSYSYGYDSFSYDYGSYGSYGYSSENWEEPFVLIGSFAQRGESRGLFIS